MTFVTHFVKGERDQYRRQKDMPCHIFLFNDPEYGKIIQISSWSNPEDRRGGPNQNFQFAADTASELAQIIESEFTGDHDSARPLGAEGSSLDPPTVPLLDIFQSFDASVKSSGLLLDPGDHLTAALLGSLLAKPFAILTGLSGSGKTQLALRLGEWFGRDEEDRPRYTVVPVRPDWGGPEALVGYEDALRSAEVGRQVWLVPEALAFVLRAAADPSYPYLLILDEMNLSHVERYFSDFLSGMESREPVLPDLERQDAHWSPRTTSAARLPLPRNLFVVGTVNVDETTYMFSPKVLDRASTFEFRAPFSHFDPAATRPKRGTAAADSIQRQFCQLAIADHWHLTNPHPERDRIVEALREIHACLAAADLEFGHRTFYESLRFAAFYAGSGDSEFGNVLDLVVMQKLLPKVHGPRRRLEGVLTNLETLAKGSGGLPPLPRTARKLARMLEALRANQFVSFSE